MNHRRVRAAFAAFLALLQPLAPAIAGSRPPVRVRAAHPALWVVHGRQGAIFLFGTIHALPPHFEWETATIRAAMAKSDKLVIEAVIDQTKDAGALVSLGTATTPLPPLAERVPPHLRPALRAMIAKSNMPMAALDKMKTWAGAMMLFGVTVANLGVASSAGVEEQLKAEFTEAGKPIEGLETMEQQLGFFDSLSEAKQREFLASVVDEKHDDAADFGRMLAAWARGDERGISASFDKDMKTSDTLRKVLLSRRNAHWADILMARLKLPGTQFVAVGAGHLTGTDSVRAMLAKHGYYAKRVE
jgi:uncharacterized protein YbaP (TraB family)